MIIGFFSNSMVNQSSIDDIDCGGAERILDLLAQKLERKGHEVHIFFITKCPEIRDSYKKDNIFYHPYPADFCVDSGRFSFSMFIHSLRIDVDIVHAHFTVPATIFSAFFYSWIKEKPLVVTHHSDLKIGFLPSWKNKLLAYISNQLYKVVLRRATCIICPSQSFAKESPHLQSYQNKIKIIPNGIDLTKFQNLPGKEKSRDLLGIPQDSRIILAVGKLYPYKGHQVLIDGAPSLINFYNNIQIVIVGEGTLKEEFNNQLEELQLKNNVILLGEISFDKLRLYYRAADIMAFPSFSENFPLTILETFACGLPLVASDIQGTSDIVRDGENGLLFKVGDSMDLTEKIVNLFNNPDIRDELIRGGFSTLDTYNLDNITTQYEAIYKKILGKGL